MKAYSLTTGNSCEQLVISNIIVSYEDSKNGNPYNTTFDVKIVSGNFAGVAEFESDIKDFIHFVALIKDLYDFKVDMVALNDIGYGSKIQFYMDKTGHITIEGTIYGEAMDHSLTFRYMTDQTAIKSFCTSLVRDFIGEVTSS